MSKQTVKRIHTAYGIVLTLLLVTVAILLIVSCVNIYRSGDRPFSTESVGAHFSAIALPVYLCVIWAAGGFVLAVALPTEKSKLKSRVSSQVTLSRLSGKLDRERCPLDLAQGIDLQRKLRLILSLVNGCLYLAGAVRSLLYILNQNNFPAAEGQFNAEILQGSLRIALFLAPPFLYSIAVSFINHASRKREIALTKEAIARSLLADPSQTPSESTETDTCRAHVCPIEKAKSVFSKHQKTILTVVRCAVLAVGLLFVLLGIFNGGMSDVVGKAIKICTECIGLG